MMRFLYTLAWLDVDALIAWECCEMWPKYGMAVTLSVINIVVLTHFRLFDFDGCLGVKEMKDLWNKRANADIKVSLPADAKFDYNSRILTSTFESLIGASEVKMMQETWFVLLDTKSTMTGFKSQVTGMLVLNLALALLILVASKSSGGTVVNFDAHTVEAVAISLAQFTWLVRLPHVYYQRNMAHLARINGP